MNEPIDDKWSGLRKIFSCSAWTHSWLPALQTRSKRALNALRSWSRRGRAAGSAGDGDLAASDNFLSAGARERVSRHAGRIVGSLLSDNDVTAISPRQWGVEEWRVVMDEIGVDEWGGLPMLLTVGEAARLLRIGRSKAYEMTTLYASSGGTRGLPVLRLGDLLRVPKFALYEFVTTGRIVQLVAQPDANATSHATAHATVARKPASKRRTGDRSQLSLLGSD